MLTLVQLPLLKWHKQKAEPVKTHLTQLNRYFLAFPFRHKPAAACPDRLYLCQLDKQKKGTHWDWVIFSKSLKEAVSNINISTRWNFRRSISFCYFFCFLDAETSLNLLWMFIQWCIFMWMLQNHKKIHKRWTV